VVMLECHQDVLLLMLDDPSTSLNSRLRAFRAISRYAIPVSCMSTEVSGWEGEK